MRIVKSWKPVVGLALILLMSSFSLSAESSVFKEPKTVSEQISKYLANINLKGQKETKRVLVDLMITPKGELLVLSTNDRSLDMQIKDRLNYKRITAPELKMNKTYTIPLTFIKR